MDLDYLLKAERLSAWAVYDSDKFSIAIESFQLRSFIKLEYFTLT